ncbi:hypothetical protein JOE26_001247 [Rhodococcus coprophilus]|uniref:Uncharacterized protein n=1 Tax=Rhodococcus coprophilus TaxID=38310 RepID=A0A2X4X8L8_9NOCA|nr:hypothetical protein [Rhodococcus coprophilus]SQI32894.1 Uncharacterised protein [Rhodococcus coprophilus]
MARGTGMSQTRRRNRKPSASSPEALAALLPNDLRLLGGLCTPGDYQSLRGNVADWLNGSVPGRGHELAAPVMNAAGLSAADFYHQVLTGGIPDAT